MSHNTRWNMAVCLPLCVAFVLFFEVVHAQQFTEVNAFGWERGADHTAPFLVDLDGNGLLDLIVGSFACLMRYEQIAPHSDEFHCIERDYLSAFDDVSTVIHDIDGDGQLDMLFATRDGIARYVQNEKNSVDFTLVDRTFLAIGQKYTPRLWLGDIDDNGLLDLLVFHSSTSLERYEQVLHQSLDFARKRDLVLPSAHNYQAGALYDIDGDGLLEMIVGGWGGELRLYRQNDVVRDSFIMLQDQWMNIDDISYGAPVMTDLDGDGLLDLFVGSYGGLIRHYKQKSLHSLDDWELFSGNVLSAHDLGSETTYLVCDLDNDGRLDILRTTYNYKNSIPLPLKHYRQTSIGSLTTELLGEFSGITASEYDKIAITDLEGDGLLDFFLLSRLSEKMAHYRQRPGELFTFDLVNDDFLQDEKITWNFPPTASFVDLDGNGKLDLLLLFMYGEVTRLEQESPTSSQFVVLEDNGLKLHHTAPFVHILDIDNDGLYEMFVGDVYGWITQYCQSSVHSTTFKRKEYFNFSTVRVKWKAEPTVVDVNNDGQPDLIVGDCRGGLSLYLNTTPSSIQGQTGSAEEFRIVQLSPNPGTDQTTVCLDLPKPQQVTISVYDVLGRERIRVADGVQFQSGRQQRGIDIRALSAGYYTVVATTATQRSAVPLLKQ